MCFNLPHLKHHFYVFRIYVDTFNKQFPLWTSSICLVWLWFTWPWSRFLLVILHPYDVSEPSSKIWPPPGLDSVYGDKGSYISKPHYLNRNPWGWPDSPQWYATRIACLVLSCWGSWITHLRVLVCTWWRRVKVCYLSPKFDGECLCEWVSGVTD